MNHHALISAGLILLFGLGSQLLAWRLRLPSILLLLISGVLIGPVFGWLDTDLLMGDLLFPFVSLSVAVILFEGGMTLKLKELRGVGRTLGLLIAVGGAVTLFLGFLAAHWILDLEWRVALLLAAVFVVTGPTVIGPLLRMIRPRGRAAALVKWEGIVNDPIGVSLALLVFEALFAAHAQADTSFVAMRLVVRTVAIGLVFGGGCGWLLGRLLERHAVPDFLQSPTSFASVVVVFVLSDVLQPESGLLAVTVMGIVLAGRSHAAVKHLLEFKENVRVLLLSSLFVLLAARIRLEDLQGLDWRAGLFVVTLILVVRPVSVWLATIGSGLSNAERIFIAWIAPRGIVAMAVVSLFALRIEELGIPGANKLVPVTFLVVVVTVLVYGLTAGPLARRLGIARMGANGILFVGAAPFVRELAKVLKGLDVPANLVDTNRPWVIAARQSGLNALHANAINDDISDRLDMSSVGKVMAMTRNDDVNSLVCLHFEEAFGRSNVYQLQPLEQMPKESNGKEAEGETVGGRRLLSKGLDYEELSDRYADGATIRRTVFTEEFDYDDYVKLHGARAVPIVLLQATRDVLPWVAEVTPRPKAGDTLIALISEPTPEEAAEIQRAAEQAAAVQAAADAKAAAAKLAKSAKPETPPEGPPQTPEA